jgi:hypothetical protein
MSNQPDQNDNGDAKADAIASVAIILIVLTAVVYWLSTL